MEEIFLKATRGKPVLLDNAETQRIAKKGKQPRRTARSAVPRKGALGALTYNAMRPLHDLWEGYMRSLLSATQRSSWGNTLVKADYHGAHLRCIQSRCPSLVNASGIVLQETLNTFVVVGTDNRHQSMWAAAQA